MRAAQFFVARRDYQSLFVLASGTDEGRTRRLFSRIRKAQGANIILLERIDNKPKPKGFWRRCFGGR
jgi:hypothetical protein